MVTLGAALDRDLVIRWSAGGPAAGVRVFTGRPRAERPHAEHAYGLVSIVPPSPSSGLAVLPRDVIVLLDTSGSMTGEPLAQARRVVTALVCAGALILDVAKAAKIPAPVV